MCLKNQIIFFLECSVIYLRSTQYLKSFHKDGLIQMHVTKSFVEYDLKIGEIAEKYIYYKQVYKLFYSFNLFDQE